VHSVVFAILCPPACHSTSLTERGALFSQKSLPGDSSQSSSTALPLSFSSPACLPPVLPGQPRTTPKSFIDTPTPNLIKSLVTMATTAMDYENPGGDRFEGQFPMFCFFLCPSATHCATLRNTRNQTLTSCTLQTRALVLSVTTAAPRLEATTATIVLVAVLLRLLRVATGKTTSTIACNSQTISPDCVTFALV